MLNEKITNLNDIITGEKETREMWVERYEKEQKEHQTTTARLMNTTSEYRDEMLKKKHAETNLHTAQR